MKYSRPIAIAVAAATALTLTACASNGTPGTTTTPGANPDVEPVSDGTFTLYAGRTEELIAPLVEQFEAETGITVDVRYAGTTELAALLIEEGEATPAGVFLSQDAGALGAVAKEGLLATLPEDISSRVDAGFTSTDGSWVGVTGRARVFVYDSEQLDADDVPATVAELTDERWNGEVALPPENASFQSFVTALRVLEGEDAAEQWLTDIVDNDPQIFPNNSSILEGVNNGDAQLGLINHYYWYQTASQVGTENMRAQLSFPEAGDAGGIVNVSGAGLLAGSSNDADAIAFLEYLVSDAGQQYFVESTFEYPLVNGIAAPEGLPSLESLTNPELDLSDLDTLSDTTAMLARVGLL